MKHILEFNQFINETAALGEWVAYIHYPNGKKLVKVLKSHRAAVQWSNKNSNQILMQPDVSGVGVMTKDEWDKSEAKYAIE